MRHQKAWGGLRARLGLVTGLDQGYSLLIPSRFSEEEGAF
jgi:hypothetical protein